MATSPIHAGPFAETSGGAQKQDRSNPGVILYLPFLRLPENPEEMVNRLALAAGIHAGDMRYKIVGSGVSQFTPALSPQKQNRLVDEMQDMGIPAVIVAEKTLKRRLKLPAARRVEITDSDLTFFDRNDNPVFRIDKDTDLLIIAADLSAKKRKQAFIAPDFNPHAAAQSFEAALKKYCLGNPSAIFCNIGGETAAGVLLEHASVHYQSMGDYMQPSAAGNFRTIVQKAMMLSKTCIADHGFAATTLARITYDENSTKRDMLTSLGRYANYMIAAAESGLVGPAGKTTADFFYKPPHSSPASDKTENDQNAYPEAAAETGDANRPKPPPPVLHSGIAARIFSTPHEIIYALVFLLGPFLSAFIQIGDAAYPSFWETATGILLTGAGLLVFPYGLILLNYKRMVENTPTSKVRSMAMGLVELTGQAKQYYDLKTTYSGTRCIYFRCRHFRKRRFSMANRWSFFQQTTRNSDTWRLERETTSGRLPFYLQDDTGRVLVRPKGALFHISKTTQEFSGTFGMWMKPDMQSSQTRIYEDIIAEGAMVYVLGKARPEKTGKSIAEKVTAALQALKKDKNRLMAYDADSNGRVDMDEWETARKDMENKIYAEMLADGAAEEQVVIGKPAYGMLPFIIADSEEGIIRKLGLRMWIFLAGGMLLIIAGAQMLLQRYAF